MTSSPEANYSKRSHRWKLIIALLVISLFFIVIVSLNIGYSPISFSEILSIIGKQIPLVNSSVDPNSFTAVDAAIILQIRLPRILAGVFIGAALAASGVLYQGVFKNPMADPYILGVSTGAAVGAGMGILFGAGLSYFGFPIIQTSAFIAAMVTVFFVYAISRVGSRVPEMTLLLSGIAITIFLGAIYQLMQVVAENYQLHALVSWTIGSLSNIPWSDLWKIVPIAIVGVLLSYFFSRDLNMISLGDETAQNLGVNTERTKKILLTIGAMMTAVAVSISGSIGFVGLMIPHITRLLVGPDHRLLLPASAIVGAIFLVVCDALARVLTGAAELPVGIITAIAGIPFFIFLLRKRKLSYRM
jgi:iron complex transport system permease protein